MKLVMLGSGNAEPHADRAGSGCLLRTPAPVLVDFGPGAWMNLARIGVHPIQVELVLISHLHADHFSDLIPLLFHQSWSLKGKTRTPLTILGPSGTRETVAGLRRAIPLLSEHVFPIEVRDMESGTFEYGAIRATPVPVSHVEDLKSVAWRVEEGGKTFVYSGDCSPGDHVVRALQGADLAVLEATCPDEHPHFTHLTAGQACDAARRAGVKRLILTHLSSRWRGRDVAAECAGRFPGELQVARDLLEAEI